MLTHDVTTIAYETWARALETLRERSGGFEATDERELRLAFDLGLSPLEAYLWHVREPELPEQDIYLDA